MASIADQNNINNILENIIGNCHPTLFNNCDRYMHLRIFVDEDVNCNTHDLRTLYQNAAFGHNSNIYKNPFPVAGFDLFSPTQIHCPYYNTATMKCNIACSARMIHETGRIFNTGFNIYNRSNTVSNTPLRLANGVSVIDSGYPGEITALFDCIPVVTNNINNNINNNNNNINFINNNVNVNNEENNNVFIVNQYERLVQICAPGLVPIYVTIVNNMAELQEENENSTG